MLKAKFRMWRPSCYRISLVGLALLGVTSCMDSKYDLSGDIDMTVNVGGEHFAIPVGSTEQIMLGNIIKADESEMMEVVGDEYHLVKKGVMEGATVDVKALNVDPVITEIESIEVATEQDIPEGGGDFLQDDINQQGNFTMTAFNVDEAVKSIQSFSPHQPSELTISLNVEGNLGYDRFTLSSLVIQFPDFLVFEDSEINESHQLVLQDTQVFDGVFSTKLKVIGYNFSAYNEGKGLPVKDGQTELLGYVNISGSVIVSNLNGTGILNLMPSITLTEMDIKTVTGNIEPDFSMDPTVVELNDIPDFLADDEVELDILNPVFKFTAGNPLNTDVYATCVLTPEKKGVDLTQNKVEIEGIRLPANASDNYMVAVVGQDGTEVEGAAQTIVVPNLRNLMRKIPENIVVNLTPGVESGATYAIDLGKTYEINDPEYDMDVPLAFGDGLYILYTDSITGLGKEMDDIQFDAANITMTALNTIPLKLEIKSENVFPKDAAGNVIDGIEISVEGIIAEGKDVDTPSESKLIIKMSEKIEGAVKKLDRLDFKVTAITGEAAGIPLKDSQWFQLTDMKLSVPGGINIDMN